MSSSILPVEATQDAVDDIQSMTSKDHLSPPATLVTKPQPPVLITEQEVMFGTAAAVAPKATPITRRMIDALRVVGAALRPPPPRPHYARQATYIEDARMAREMDRL
ncbi:MAG TPA: hypothetical protein VKI00_22770 [Mycobacterium sp.]|uniref:hypothetical protein n=1 Tax=Mycobacterium sp. TaxID=1785 RepID=UPI002BA1180B|nr:hypothetical protein [Mycobacterium sp.]HME78367.1 hypothetical protein [Mycobacterium sp.]